jgi:TPR repeat protein
MLVIVTTVALLVIILAVVWLRPEPEPEPVPAPGPARPLETVEPAETPAERGDSARDIIGELEADADSVDYTEAYRRAEEFMSQGRMADAQLLYFFAARGGHAPAAFSLATFYDPNHHSQDSGLMDEPDPFQAYKWYGEAKEAGNENAAARLDELRAWAERAAAAGNADAERLLLQWE